MQCKTKQIVYLIKGIKKQKIIKKVRAQTKINIFKAFFFIFFFPKQKSKSKSKIVTMHAHKKRIKKIIFSKKYLKNKKKTKSTKKCKLKKIKKKTVSKNQKQKKKNKKNQKKTNFLCKNKLKNTVKCQ